MPNRRQLRLPDPAPAAPNAPALPNALTLAVAALISAVVLAAVAALAPGAREALLVAAALGGTPAAIVAVRTARAMPGGDRDLGASRTDPALLDPLTGAGNAAALDRALEAAVVDPATVPLALVRLAITPVDGAPTLATDDDASGDDRRSLVLTAIRWQEILRPADRLVRLAGREFGVLLPGCDDRAVRAVVGRLCAAAPDGLHVAHGVATWDEHEPGCALLTRAEQALEDDRGRPGHETFTDPGRLAAVTGTGLPLGRPLAEFNEIAGGIAWLLDTPVVLISLFDDAWQHYIGAHGIDLDGAIAQGSPIRDAICRTTVATGRPLVVSDTRRHPLLQSIPATRDHGVLACASVPITTGDGHVLGSICSMVMERHAWTGDDVALLKLTARRIADRLAQVPLRELSAA